MSLTGYSNRDCFQVVSSHRQPFTLKSQPPQEKIITSKDQAIKRLIQENSVLKRQLSQFMLSRMDNIKQIPQSKLKQVQSTTTSARPSCSYSESHRNSLDNSIDVRVGLMMTKNHQYFEQRKVVMINSNLNNVPTIKQKNPQTKTHLAKRNHSYRHSIDMCSNIQSAYDAKHQGQNQFTFPCQQNFTQSKHGRINKTQNFQSSPIDNLNCYQSPHVVQNISIPTILKKNHQPMFQDQLYQQKMIKLKSKKNLHSKRLSEDKNTLQFKIQQSRNCIIQNPGPKAYKCNTQSQYKLSDNTQQSYSLNRQCNRQVSYNLKKIDGAIQPQQIDIPFIQKEKQNSTIENCTQTTKNQPQIKVLYKKCTIEVLQQENPTQRNSKQNQENQSVKMMKNFPKFHVKSNLNSSRQKPIQKQKNCKTNDQLKYTQTHDNQRFKKVQSNLQQSQRHKVLKNTEKQTSSTNISLKQLRGRIYFQEQLESLKSKISGSLSRNDTSEADSKNLTKVSSEISKPIPTVESQITYVCTGTLKHIENNTVKQDQNKDLRAYTKIIKKSSNQVYLELDQDEKKQNIIIQDRKNRMKQARDKQNKLQDQQIRKKKSPNLPKKDESISIEDLHMIESQNATNHQKDCQTSRKQHSHQAQTSHSSNFKQKQTINGNRTNTVLEPNKQPSNDKSKQAPHLYPDFHKPRKQLNNQIYVSESKYKIKK